MDVPLEALTGGGVVIRPNFARVMLRCWDVSSLWKTFDRYLDKDEYQRIERWKAGAPECIAAIPEQSTTYLCLAETYGLHITGDRDFYGETVRHDTTLTPIPLDLD